MATLVSPGVDVQVIDESFYASSGPGTIPLIIIATAGNKPSVTGRGFAPGTIPGSGNSLYSVSSQRELVQLFGLPKFYEDQGSVVQGYELNEYGLLAAYNYLGIANPIYVLRADLDLDQLFPRIEEPRSEALSGTYWLDTALSSWGVFESNGNSVPGLAWKKKNVIVVDTIEETETYVLGDIGFTSLTSLPITSNGPLIINSVSVNLTTSDTLANVVTKINAASIPNIVASALFISDRYYLLIRNTQSENITISTTLGSPILFNLGLIDYDVFTAPKQTLGLEWDTAIVTLSNDNVVYQKITPKDYYGQNIAGATAFWFVVGSKLWKAATPTVVFGVNPAQSYVPGDDITISDGINSVTVTFTSGTPPNMPPNSVNQAVNDINNAINLLPINLRPKIVASNPIPTQLVLTNYEGGDIIITDIGNRVVNALIINSGTGYTSLPTVTFAGGGGVGASADVIQSIDTFNLVRRGGGYNVGDLLTLSGGSFLIPGTVSVSAVESYHTLDTVNIVSGGSSYPASATFTFNVAGPLSGLQDTNIVLQLTTDAGGTVVSATILNRGYIFSPPLSPIPINDSQLTQISGPPWPGSGSGLNLNLNLVQLQKINQITLSSGGTGYTVGDILTIVGGTFNYQARVRVTQVDTFGTILSSGWELIDPGEYLAFTPGVVTTTGGSGTGATFNLISLNNLTNSIKLLSVSNSGQYTTTPTNPILLTGGVGNNATINSTFTITDSAVKLGAVGTPVIFDPGFNWSVGNFLEIQGGVRTQPTRLRVLSVTSYNRFNTNYTLVTGGTGYVVGDIITVGGGSGTPAQLLVTSVGPGGVITGTQIWYGGNYITAPTGSVSSVTIATSGSGYSNGVFTATVLGGTFSSPATLTVTVSGGIVTAVSVATPGVYTVPPTNPVQVSGLIGGTGATFNLTFTAATVTGGSGSGAQVFGPIQLVNGGITNVEIINPGKYSVLPAPLGPGFEGINLSSQALAGPGTAAKFDLVYGISEIIPTNGGDGYNTPPSITITGGGGSGALAQAVLGQNTQTLVSLGLSSRLGNRLFYAPHFNIPPQSAKYDIWIKTTKPTGGADWKVKLYSRFTKQWSLIPAPFYVDDDQASFQLGTNISAGVLYVKYNVYGTSTEPIASHVIKRWTGPGPLIVTGSVVSPNVTPGDQFSMTFYDQDNNLVTVTVTLSGTDLTQTIIDMNTALSGAGVTNIIVQNSSGQLRISNTRSLTIKFENISGDPLSDLGINEQTYSKWEDLIYEASVREPTTPPEEGTLWYNSVLNVPDIMVNDGTRWRGYRNVYPLTDPNGPILSSTPPTQQSNGNPLVDNDLWINTSQEFLDDYPKIYRWSTLEQSWIPIDNTDQSTPFGIVFADARPNANGQINGSKRIQDMLLSDYVDPDVGNPVGDDPVFPNPLTYPTGMLLFNTRYSNFNVKVWKPNWLEDFVGQPYDVGLASFPAGTIDSENKGRWVTFSGNQIDGSPYMGRRAQRRVIINSLAKAIKTNEDIRAEDVFFNIIAAPGYPELLGDMRDLNIDKREIAFIIGDTPARLKADSQSIVNWLRNVNQSVENDERGFAGPQYTYSAIYYPWGLSTNTDGKRVMVPPSHMVLRTIAYNDQVAYPWFAPAGYTRGIVQNAQSVGFLNNEGEFTPVVLSQGQRDVMYVGLNENRPAINPISNQVGRGLVVFGQKTLHPISSALDRVNVARLVCFLRYNFDILAKPFLFEPNDKETRNQVKEVFENFLNNMISLRAIDDYAVQCDEGNNTPDRIDRNELWIDVAIVPLRAIEYIYIPIRIRNTGEI